MKVSRCVCVDACLHDHGCSDSVARDCQLSHCPALQRYKSMCVFSSDLNCVCVDYMQAEK